MLDLVAELRAESNTAVLFISHNLGVIAQDVRPRRRAVCRRAGRGGHGRARCSTTRATPTPSACCAASRGAASARTTAGSTRSRASCRRPARDLPGCVFVDRCAIARDRCRTDPPPPYDARRRPAQPLPLPRGGARPAAADARRRGDAGPVPHEGAPILRADRRGEDVQAVAATTSTRWPACRPSCGRARRWAWWASPAPARRRSRASCSASPRPTRAARSSSTASVLAARVGKRSDDDVRAMQIVFQNPDSALNRSHTVRRLVGRALSRLAGLSGAKREERLRELTDSVRLQRALPRRAAVGALRRPQAARRHRARLRRRPAAGGLRRADQRARRVGAGGDPQPAGRPAAREARRRTCSSRTTSASCATCPTASRCCTSAG